MEESTTKIRSGRPGNDDALRAIKLFTSKIADAVIEGRALATEHDFHAVVADVVADEDSGSSIDMSSYAQYVDPKYSEELMSETLIISELDLPSMSLPKKAPEVEEAPVAAAPVAKAE